MDLHTIDGLSTFPNFDQTMHWAEEYECAMMHLDHIGAPRERDGETLSIVGRIDAAISNGNHYNQ